MIPDNLSPYIRIAFDSMIYPPWALPERVIFDYELLYVKEGEILVTIEDDTFTGNAGDIFLFRPKQRHSIRLLNNCRFWQPHIHFDFFYQEDSPDIKVSFWPLSKIPESEMKMFRKDITSELGVQIPGKICLRNPAPFEEMLFSIIREYEMKIPFFETNMKGLFIQLWIYLMRKCHWSNTPNVLSNFEELLRIKNYLSHNIYKEVSLDELAAIANLSKYHLVRLFKKAFSMSPIRYHQLIRIEKAKEMVQFTDFTLTKISDMMGFQSIHAFSRAFKIIEGVPPSFYRTRQDSRK